MRCAGSASLSFCFFSFVVHAIIREIDGSGVISGLESIEDRCLNRQYGPTCNTCPTCQYGRCDDGRLGSGNCREEWRHPGKFVKDTLLLLPESDVVVTTFFTSKPNPQRRRKQQIGTEAFVRWLRSVAKLKMIAVILHDGLPQSLMVHVDQNMVRTVQVRLSDRSVNDQRFLLYRLLLRNELEDVDSHKLQFVPEDGQGSIRVLFTDMFDVEFYKNPFGIFFGRRYKLYVGSHKGAWNRWLYARIRACRLNFGNSHSRYYNAGIIGGSLTHILNFLDCFWNVTLSLRGKAARQNCNMPVFALCIMKRFSEREVFTGLPLHSSFGHFEGNNSNIYIRHK